jgi:threonyl-tRNA synthetase
MRSRWQADLKEAGFRVGTDLRNEKIGFKIREHELAKVPLVLVVGDKEMTAGTVAVRGRHGADLGSLNLAALMQLMGDMSAKKGRLEA